MVFSGFRVAGTVAALALLSSACCEKSQPAVQEKPAEVVKAEPVKMEPPVIDYDKLAAKVAEKIDTEQLVTKVVDQLKAKKLVGNAPEGSPEMKRIRPELAKGDLAKARALPRAMVDDVVWKVQLRGDEAQKGSKTPLVTVVVFSDYQCPFCKKVEPTIDQLIEKYGADVSIIWKNNPLGFHKNARPAAQASCSAQMQGKFWEMHKLLFDNNQKLEKTDIDGYARGLGLDMAKFEADFNGADCARMIDDDMRLANDVGARGTPNLYINGRQLRGALPFEQVEPIIQEEMKKSKALVEKGTRIEGLYAEIVKNGKLYTPLEETVAEFKEPCAFKGPETAPVVFTVYSDFQCPFCSKLLKTEYEVFNMFQGQLRLEFRNFPLSFHKDAHLAAQAAMAANAQGKFWEMHDKLFENQKALGRADLEKYAQELGLDMAAFKKALDEGTFKDIVDRQMAEGQKAGVRGTPTLFINGRKFQAPSREPAAIKKIIEDNILVKK